MSLFNPPFAHQTTRIRKPTPTEILDGFQCGDFSRSLFNGIINCLYTGLNDLKWIHAGQFCMDEVDPNDATDTANAGTRQAFGGQASVDLEDGQAFWINHQQLSQGEPHVLQMRCGMKSTEAADIAFQVETYLYNVGDVVTNDAPDKVVIVNDIATSDEFKLMQIELPNILLAADVPNENTWANFRISRVAATNNHTGTFSAIAGRIV